MQTQKHYETFSGCVVHGLTIGRTMGFPTANIEVTSGCLPPQGIYLTRISFNRKDFFGIMNIGTKPTIDGKNLSIEIHILDFDEDIYNLQVSVLPIEKLRDEKKFTSLALLRQQIEKDKEIALKKIQQIQGI